MGGLWGPLGERWVVRGELWGSKMSHHVTGQVGQMVAGGCLRGWPIRWQPSRRGRGFDAEFRIFLADLGELGVNGVELGGDSHYARDSGADNGEDCAFAGGYGLECVRGEVLNQVGVQLKAFSGLGEEFCKEGERG